MKFSKLPAFLIAIASFSSHATDGGNQLDWAKNHSNLVEMNCTGTLLGSKWILTAAHCSWDSAGGLRPVLNHQGHALQVRQQYTHHLEDSNGIDIAVWELEKDYHASSAWNKLSNISPRKGDEVKFYGFGGGELSNATQKVTEYVGLKIHLEDLGKGVVVEGDSGGPILNAHNEIVGVVSGYNGGTTGSIVAFDDGFIQDTVNGFHYPTFIELKGTAVIPVQSLHIAQTIMFPRTTGDVEILEEGSTCHDKTFTPFSECVIKINSDGGQGKLYLTNDEYIQVNRAPEPKKVTPESKNKDSGGSFFYFLALPLLFISRRSL